MSESLTILTTFVLFVAATFGLAWLNKSSIAMVIKMLVQETFNREERQRALIYEAQVVERGKVHGQEPTSLTPPGVNGALGVLEEVNQMRVDASLFMSALQLEMDAFKNDILPNCPCPEEFRLECKDRIERLENTIKNGS